MNATTTERQQWTAQEIRELRLRLHLTLREAAAKVGVSLRQWVYWEAGTNSPRGSACILLDQMSQGKI